MIKKVKFRNFTEFEGNRVIVETDNGRNFQFLRNGITEDEVRNKIKEMGKTEAINFLITEGKLKPKLGGKIIF